MDELNTKKLNLRLMNLYRDYEGKTLSFDIVNQYFSYNELLRILDASRQKDMLINLLKKLDLSLEFQKIIDQKSVECFERTEINDFMQLASDDVILDCLANMTKEHSEQYGVYLKTDKARIEALNYASIKNNPNSSLFIIMNMDDDDLKIKYMHLVGKNNISSVLSSIKNVKLKENLIDRFPKDSGVLISTLENEEERIYYYEKYFKKLDSYNKKLVFGSLSEENKEKYLQRYWKKLSDEEKCFHLSEIGNDELVLEKARESLSDLHMIQLVYVLGDRRKELTSALVKNISYTNPKRLVKKMKSIGVECFDKLDILTLFSKHTDREKLNISDLLSIEVKLVLLSTMKNFKNTEKIINHEQDLPKYDERYNSLIVRYAEKYHLNKEHLIELVRVSGLEILKNIRSLNIQKIVNLKDDSFDKLMMLFDPDKYKMDSSTLNDNINIFLQRTFKQQYPDIINISSHIRLGIQNGEKSNVLSLLEDIIEQYDISQILNKYNYNSEQFLSELMKNEASNVKVIECLLEITNGYIVYKRNEFIKEHIFEFQHKFSNSVLDVRSALNFVIKNYPVEFLREKVFNPKKVTSVLGYGKDEIDFVNHPEVLDMIVDFKRNSFKYEAIPENVKKYMSTFNKLFEKNFNVLGLGNIDNDIKRVYFPVSEVDQGLFRDVLMDLDVELLEQGILKDENSFKLLHDTLTKYKLFGISEQMRDSLSRVDISTDSYTLSYMIKYFPTIYEDLNLKKDRGEIKNITVSSILDMAQCYSLESNKITKLLGKQDARLISSNPGPNSSSWQRDQRLNKAQEYLKHMYKRNYVSIPSSDSDLELSNGKKINVVVGNVSEPINLTYGERTGACMRMGGHADDLFKFCLTDDNGFHIRFSDPKNDEFISRVSGFRNGNTVFLNELRYSENIEYTNDEVKEACILAARGLIEQSKDCSSPIENVVVAPDFVMKGERKSSLNVNEIRKGVGAFYTDVRADNATVLATSNPDNSLVAVKLGNEGVKKYPVQRGKVRYYDGEKALDQLDKIEMLDQMFSGVNIEDTVTPPKRDVVFCYCGEDWYVSMDSNGVISEYVMANSNKKEIANREKMECVNQIRQKFGINANQTLQMHTENIGGVRK